MNNDRYIAILAGGIGARFWPSSTKEKPKQFLDILNIGKSLIQLTYERCLKIVPNENILIVTNEDYKALVAEHLPNLPKRNILCEPSMNNTAPCVAYTALHIEARNPNATFAVLPSDHVILKETEYLDRVNEAFEYANANDAIVTLGIKPTRPDTGYGYIELGKKDEANKDSIFSILAFKEKPTVEIAKQYLDSGNYLWNAGMFVWKVSTILNSFKENANEILSVLSKDKSKIGSDEEQSYIDQVYPQTEKISVDYAILERAKNVFTIPSDIGWSDLGTWGSLHSYLDKDASNNVVHAQKSHIEDVNNSLIRAQQERIIVIKGLDNFIVVDEPGALLIYPKDKEQEIKAVVKNLKNIDKA